VFSGLYFSIRTRFLQVRHIKNVSFADGKSSESGVSSFQALSMSLAGRVVQVILQV
jgi:AGCS family alanine or glycine:cation symporter